MKTTTTSIKQTGRRAAFFNMALLAFAIGAPSLRAQTDATWNFGADPNTYWNVGALDNWTGNVDPDGNDVIFGSTGLVDAPATVTNTVSEDISINSLTYRYDSATDYHVTEILEGVTLSVGGATNVFTVGGQTKGVTITQTVIRGLGALDITQTGGVVFLGNNNSGETDPPAEVHLDMSGLSSFSANLGATGSFLVGAPPVTNPQIGEGSYATVRLADKNEITAKTLSIGADHPLAATSNILRPQLHPAPTTLFLGRENTIHADGIYVAGYGVNHNYNAALRFDPSVADGDATVIIRNAAGTGRVTQFQVGVNGNTGGSATQASQFGIADFSGGMVDLLVNNLIIGMGANWNAGMTIGSTEGKFIMDAGVVDATTVVIGHAFIQASDAAASTIGTLTVDGGTFTAGSVTAGQTRFLGSEVHPSYTGTAQGIINIGGDGQFTATTLTLANSPHITAANTSAVSGTLNLSDNAVSEVTNGIVMGQHGAALNAAPLTATINISDASSLTVHGNIAKGLEGAGGITATINLDDSGTLNMDGHDIVVDHFRAASGTLLNVGEFNNGADLVKTTSGTLIIGGINTYTGGTIVEAGALHVAGSLSNGNVTVDADAAFSLLSTGELQFNITDGVAFDQFTLNAGGDAAFAGTLRFNLADDFESGSWLLFNGTAAGDFTNLDGIVLAGEASGSLNFVGNNLWETTIGEKTYTFDGGNGMFSIVPEPSAALLCLLGGLVLSGISRRRKACH